MRYQVLGLIAVTAALLGACGSGSQGADIPGTGGDDGGANMLGADQSFPPTGNSYVDARRCPACHQSTNPQQDGFMSGAVSPVPGDFGSSSIKLYGPNLTPDPTTGIGNWDDSQIANAILNGIDNQGEELCPEMGHFPGMQPDELTSIIGYLHSLKPVVHQTQTSSCPPLKQ
jgi:hypothetical protein